MKTTALLRILRPAVTSFLLFLLLLPAKSALTQGFCVAFDRAASNEVVSSVATPDGMIILTAQGTYYKLDNLGNPAWVQFYPVANTGEGREIIATSDGNFAILYANGFLSRIDPLGNYITTLWLSQVNATDIEFNSVIQTSDDGFALVGTVTRTPTSGIDMAVVRLNADGSFRWMQYVGGIGFEEGYFVGESTNQDIWALGYTSTGAGVGDVDLFLVRIDILGTVISQRAIGDDQPQFPQGMVAVPPGNNGWVIATENHLINVGPAGNLQNQTAWTVMEGADLTRTVSGEYVVTGRVFATGNIGALFFNSVGTLTNSVQMGSSKNQDGGYQVCELSTTELAFAAQSNTSVGTPDLFVSKLNTSDISCCSSPFSETIQNSAFGQRNVGLELGGMANSNVDVLGISWEPGFVWANNCAGGSIRQDVTEFIEPEAASEVRVYPNPATDRLILELPNANGPTTATLYNTMGSLVRQKLIRNDREELSVADLPPGVYTLVLNNTAYTHQQKVMIH